MIIVSQDKTETINFDNIVRLSISNNMNGQFLIECHNFCDDFETVIGLYSTEERAKEVLEEITLAYTSMELINTRQLELEMTLYGRDLAQCICFKMPKE